MDEARTNAANVDATRRPGVLEFFRGRRVFVTGGTGFLGKVIVERLLRQLEVDTVYVLVREKRGASAHSRLDQMTDDSYYDALKRKEPKFKHKLVPIGGDCVFAGLGLSIDDARTLRDNVEIVLHCAATVRFNERLDRSFAVNVTGTRGVVHLCHGMRRLRAFVHVSTAYANCHLPHVEERFYEYAVGADEVAAALAKLTAAEVDARAGELVGAWPNTYTYTKALAEQVVRAECEGRLPAAVFRPAIILSTYGGATPGWIDNVYGPVGASASIYAGFGRVAYFKETESCNVVPVDKVADGILAAAWEVGTRYARDREIKVYNYVSSSTPNDINWLEYASIGTFYSQQYPPLKSKRPISLSVARNESMYNLLVFVFHYVPALAMDFFLLLSGRKPKFFHMYKKLHTQMAAVMFFVGHAWSFDHANVQQLYAALSLEDRRLLPLDVLDINWKLFMKNYILGIRRYIFKEDDSTIAPALRKLRTIERLDNLVKYALYFLVANYVYGAFCNIGSRLLFG